MDRYFKAAPILMFLFAIQCTVCSVELFARDKIIAVVNNDVITQKDLNDFLNFMRMELSGRYKGRELERRLEALKQDLLNKLIEDRLILQEAKKENLKPDSNRLKARLNEIKEMFPTEVAFQQDLAKQGLVPADIENKIREQMLMYDIIEIKVKDKISVRPDEVTSFYQKNTKEFVSPPERELSVIALENEDQARSFAHNLQRGEKLEDLAMRYPVSLNKIYAKERGELKKEIEDVVFNLGIGEVSAPLKIDGKCYVLKLENIMPSRQLTLAESQSAIHSYLYDIKMQEGMARWLDELKSKSYIKIY